MIEEIKRIITEMRRIVRDDSAHGHTWSQTCGDGVDDTTVERWATELEKAIE